MANVNEMNKELAQVTEMNEETMNKELAQVDEMMDKNGNLITETEIGKTIECKHGWYNRNPGYEMPLHVYLVNDKNYWLTHPTEEQKNRVRSGIENFGMELKTILLKTFEKNFEKYTGEKRYIAHFANISCCMTYLIDLCSKYLSDFIDCDTLRSCCASYISDGVVEIPLMGMNEYTKIVYSVYILIDEIMKDYDIKDDKIKEVNKLTKRMIIDCLLLHVNIKTFKLYRERLK